MIYINSPSNFKKMVKNHMNKGDFPNS